jgi:hypothetical protein
MNDNDKRNKTIPDGGRLRVSLDMMDGVQRDVRHHVTDGFGNSDYAALHRRGARFSTDALARDAARVARAEYEAALSRAYLPSTFGGDQPGTQEGARSSEDEPGNRRRRRRAQYRDPEGRGAGTEEWDSERERATATDAAYADYERELSEAWRTK